ncbi:Zn finger-containing GTPase- Activating Protein for ARF [Orbilia oligospora]|uniref:Zn finger-containing GTPase-Activating Protein for ARF n=2 Tax=Orbilia oligospora TaxID=2813651 RepID=A0A7C8NU45_ORBOL|nr:Zn finger-containing GTPase- Activating Protein for ARF [Orbilia oligospora]KAF3105249.1 Zn finger-containing GTPase- Activating Protein for ARF [Orbilia oligospora]KAF3106182.1 Zn finger-containing GTPase- Activating Protein for ARF [Orbilia oligospora]KAF3128129.1 Zn finger-containing GTPase- Activating Protein for ARF [Orbilia oligospora]KAF3133058.1 Zn finger-containing GTPase- Activating Protein for ARF [Orbilia oligospora]
MASSGMWEVDPETRRKLLELQKKPGNGSCVDCDSPSPQWASPKFGIFLCLSCAGVHRGLGVHISFVRSITMDQFKTSEILRMTHGGNKALKEYFESCPEYSSSMSVAERYSAPFAEDYKEKLTCLVEGTEWTGPKPREATPAVNKNVRRTGTGGLGSGSNSNAGTPRSSSPAVTTQKQRNESYFEKMGAENAGRREDLPPNQGGKYSGFGSTPLQEPSNGGIGGWDDVTKDPVGALTKGWGFFTSSVAKGAKQVNEGFVQPTAKMIAESDVAGNVQRTALQVGSGIATTAKSGADTFNRMIDQQARGNYQAIQPEKRDFWDSFGDAEWDDDKPASKNSAIGTSGIKKAGGGSGAGGKKNDDWGDDW